MKTKFYQLENGFLVVTSKGNFLVGPNYIKKTLIQPEERQPVNPDVTVQGFVENAISEANDFLSKSECEIFQCLVEDAMIDAAGGNAE